MSFFQNLFDQEFQGYWYFTDRKYSLDFKIGPNKNRSDLMLAWNEGPYNLASPNNILTINFAFDKSFKAYAALAIDVSGATPSATEAAEVADELNADTTFKEFFEASIENAKHGGTRLGGPWRVVIKSKRPKADFRAYISNTGAETKLKFNKYGGVADLPSYFDRHTIANRFAFDDSQGNLIRLSHAITAISVANPTQITSVNHGLTTGDTIYIVNSNSTPTVDGQRTVTVVNADNFTVPVNVTTAGTRGEWLSATEKGVVDDAGLDYSAMLEDWEHLKGRSGYFMFRKETIDGSDRVTELIEYQAGAKVGDLARKIIFTYTGANKNFDKKFEMPHILASGDLVTPP